MEQKFPEFPKFRKKGTTSGGCPQFSKRVSRNVLFHWILYRNFRKFWSNGSRPESSLHPPTKLLFRCLAVTDLCIGLITQPVFSTFLMSFGTTSINWKVNYYTDQIQRASSFTLVDASILFHRNKCWQTSRPVVGDEIQTHCNITAGPCCCDLLLVDLCFMCTYALLE